jgi:predicted restriction endonuclease
MRKWLRSVHGEHVAVTGRLWRWQHEVQGMIERAGGIPTPRGDVTAVATVLVRGDSSSWAFGEFGTKESEAARRIRKGASICLIYDSDFRDLLEHGRPARAADRIAGEPVQWLAPATKPQFERVAHKDGPLDREHTTLGRVEQSYLRHVLFRDAEHATYSLCGRKLPVGVLIAAHVKPRSECSRRERLDVENIVFGVCLLGCDALYERGLVSVGEEGRVLVSTVQSSSALRAVLKRFAGRKCDAWNATTAEYFEWHRRGRFQG